MAMGNTEKDLTDDLSVELEGLRAMKEAMEATVAGLGTAAGTMRATGDTASAYRVETVRTMLVNLLEVPDALREKMEEVKP